MAKIGALTDCSQGNYLIKRQHIFAYVRAHAAYISVSKCHFLVSLENHFFALIRVQHIDIWPSGNPDWLRPAFAHLLFNFWLLWKITYMQKGMSLRKVLPLTLILSVTVHMFLPKS